MTLKTWKRLYSEIPIEETPYNILPKPTVSQINEFENDIDLRLPSTYRTFVQVFGAGDLGGFRIVAPGYPRVESPRAIGPRYSFYDFMDRYNTHWRGSAFGNVHELTWMERVVYFTINPMSGNIVGWDTGDIRDARRREYGIIEIDYSTLDEIPILVAESFYDFVTEICLGQTAADFFGEETKFIPALDVM